tara:strand:+ start:245 stop:574 length:330 start_codon:yes stop_codon:yes gene_type:complete
MVELTKKEERVVEKEVRKRLHKRVYERTKNSALRFKKEFKRHTVTAITAAFGFLVALSWRTPIQNSVNQAIISLGLVGKEIYVEYISALAITIIAVIAIMIVSKWSSES